MKKKLIIAALIIATSAMAQRPAMVQRIRGTIAAINGTAEEFEAYAQSGFAKSYLDKTTADERRRLHARIRGEYGVLSPGAISREAPTRVSVAFEGANGKRGRLIIDHETDDPMRITALDVAAAGAEVPPDVPIDGGMTGQQVAAALDPYLKKLADEGRFSGTVLIARDGTTVFAKGYGLANRADNIANTPATRFNLGSINKDFTKTAIAQLAAAGKLTLDDAIGKHLPDYANAEARGITIRQLLEHTGGLADLFSPEYDRMSKGNFRVNRDFYDYLAPQPVKFPAGSQTAYCNSCYIVLGEIVARLSGMPYEKYVEENVFRRAGMTQAGFFHSDDIRPNVATGYTARGGRLRSNIHTHSAGGNAAGGAYATAADLLAFDNALREGRLLDRKWTSWLFKAPEASGRIAARRGMAGGSLGINAVYGGDGKWTVVVMTNFDPPYGENLGRELLSSLEKETR